MTILIASVTKTRTTSAASNEAGSDLPSGALLPLAANLPSAEAAAATVVPILPPERIWLTLGQTLVTLHASFEASRRQPGLSGAQRDAAGYTARGLAIAVTAWNDVTRTERGTQRGWERLARTLAAEVAGGYREPMRAGLTLALREMQSSLEAYGDAYAAAFGPRSTGRAAHRRGRNQA